MRFSKNLYSIFAGIFTAANLLVFLVFYLPNYVFSTESLFLDYFQYFLTAAAEFFLPALTAVLLLFGAVRDGKHTVFLRTLYLTLPRLIYLIPYYYLYMTAYGNDWLESLTLSLLVSMLGCTVWYIRALVLYFVGFFVARRIISKKLYADLPPARQNNDKALMRELAEKAERLLPSELSNFELFDLSLPSAAGIFSIAFLQFAVSTITEIYSVVIFIIEYGAFRTGELIYTIVKFVFVFTMLFVSHVLCYIIFSRLPRGEKENANV